MLLGNLLAQIARRDSDRTEATLQADIRQLVLMAPPSLATEIVVTADLETPSASGGGSTSRLAVA